MEKIVLTEIEGRVLGSLIEKERTTPEYYPLSLNALTNACNQINNRDPVVTYGENEVLRAVESLRDKRLAYASSGAVARVVKYGHKAVEILELSPAELAVMDVLMLRGPQTLGEIRGRTGRMHEFADLAAVQSVLQALASRPEPLVVCLPRQAGTKESRYAHLLAGEVVAAANSRPVDSAAPVSEDPDRVTALENEVGVLRSELADLRRQFEDFRKQLG
ncbi:MAG TPA: YceH family protein [Candidatus Didemnitutus sp.]|nr:YceH family protein [Candidatus Didemnitutus sp.]